METSTAMNRLGSGFQTGERHYRAFVGPREKYDLMSAVQFNLLTRLGLREHHALLDLGCGCLRAGRLFIVYLLPGNYCGLEPEEWLVEEGINYEIGHELIALKKPSFLYNSNFEVAGFARTFDYLLAQSIFSHASPKQIEMCLREAKNVMTADSIFAATYVEGEENYARDEWVYPACVTYSANFIADLAGRHGLKSHRLAWPHPNGQRWVAFTAEKNDYDFSELTLTGK